MNQLKPEQVLPNKEELEKDKEVSVKKFVLTRKQLILLGLLFTTVIGGIFLALLYKAKISSTLQKIPVIKKLVKTAGEKDQDLFGMDMQFAKFPLQETQVSPQLPEYKISVSKLQNLTHFEKNQGLFSQVQKQALEQDNFFIAQNLDKFYKDDPDDFPGLFRDDDWTYLYHQISGPWPKLERRLENSVFITSDFLLHVYHKLVEKEFEYIEQKEFYPRLKEITDKLFQQATALYASSSGADKESFERIAVFFAVPKALLDAVYPEFSSSEFVDTEVDTQENIYQALEKIKSEMSEAAYQKARQELELILKQEDMTPSPLFGKYLSESNLQDMHDYTQYGPRSHYSKNSVLRSYFRSMIWFGRNYFAIESSELTRDAIYITQLVKDTQQQKNWDDIYIPTAFFVGKSDDLSFYDYQEVMGDIKTVDDSLVAKVQKEMKNYKSPQIMSSAMFGDKVFELSKEELQEKTKGFRFMGQRFTPDAFIFSSLTQGDEKPDPETGESLPSTPTALMVMSVLGNKTAKPFVNEWIKNNAPDSSHVLANKMSKLDSQFEKVPQEVWTQNIYWGWLYTIKSLFTKNLDKTGYPMFMKNNLWERKNLQASLGSWTELKHDTLLYAKQSYAEMGAGGPQGEVPPVPKGYVEPNIYFFDRLIALSSMTKEGLMKRGLLNHVFIGRHEQFIKSLEFFRDIAVKQLENKEISDDEFEDLRQETKRLASVVAALPGEILKEDDVRSALIADVHTDAVMRQILYEATGIPNYIYVAVSDKNGIRLTKGLVFSHYEFTAPIGKRLTDEDWKELNYVQDKSQLPEMADWSKSLIK